MIKRSTKIQLLLFVIMSLVGVSFVAFNYVGLGTQLFGSNACTVSANFPDSGGIFTNAEQGAKQAAAKLGYTIDYVGPTTADAAGQVTTTTLNPITLTLPAAGVEGYLDDNGDIQDRPGAAGATFAIDYNNGVIVFKSGVTGAGGVVTTAVTVSYSYITNYDDFQVNSVTALLATGETPQMYLNRMIGAMDVTAAKMGQKPRYMRPNFVLGSLMASTWITQATIFYQQANPRGTGIYPTENYYFERNGLRGARVNAPLRVGDTRLLFSRLGATKYGLDTPFEVKGPYPTYDSNGKIISKDLFYGEELSVIATPQAKNSGGTILNPVSRTLILR